MLIAALPSLVRAAHSGARFAETAVVEAGIEFRPAATANHWDFVVRVTLAPGWTVSFPDGLELAAEGAELTGFELPPLPEGSEEFEIRGGVGGGPGVLRLRVRACEVGRCLAPIAFGFDVPGAGR
jgi:hypothetical protein